MQLSVGELNHRPKLILIDFSFIAIRLLCAAPLQIRHECGRKLPIREFLDTYARLGLDDHLDFQCVFCEYTAIFRWN